MQLICEIERERRWKGSQLRKQLQFTIVAVAVAVGGKVTVEDRKHMTAVQNGLHNALREQRKEERESERGGGERGWTHSVEQVKQDTRILPVLLLLLCSWLLPPQPLLLRCCAVALLCFFFSFSLSSRNCCWHCYIFLQAASVTFVFSSTDSFVVVLWFAFAIVALIDTTLVVVSLVSIESQLP